MEGMKKLVQRLGAGFTLIELMIVVAIIGILAAIAIPNFVKFQCRSKQSEAKTNLKAMYVAYQGYYSEFSNYPDVADPMTTTNHIGWHPKGAVIRYDYGGTGNATGFTGTGTGNTDSVAGDVWTITNANDLSNSNNSCS
jgi:type IV pilus assembly protein PilA